MESELGVKKQKQKMKLVKWLLITMAIIILILGIVEAVRIYTTVKNYEDKIYPDIWIEDLNIGGKSKVEADKEIRQKHSDVVNKKNLTIKANNHQYNIEVSKLGIQYNYNEILKDSYEFGKNHNIFEKYTSIISPVKKVLALTMVVSNKNYIDPIISQIEKENYKSAKDATLIKNGSGEFVVTDEDYGYKVDVAQLKSVINEKIKNIEKEDELLILAKIDKVEPKIKGADLKNINAVVSSFTTNFSGSNSNRCTNIGLAAGSINGKYIMPGGSFSFNDIVGQRTAERGYKLAHVIKDNKFVDDYGGGICQVSTTLYNAVIGANILSVERNHHSIASSYVGYGMDATVSYGSLDYKFKNTLQYPIYIESVISGKRITFNIYSNSSLTNRKYALTSDTVGKKAKVYKVTYENGKQIEKKYLYTDTINLEQK